MDLGVEMEIKLVPADTAQERIMDRGMFDLFHAWDTGDGFRVEYWRGIDNNGAILRTLHNGRMARCTHYATPGSAIRVLLIGGYPVPGVPALTPDDRQQAEAYAFQQLRAGHVTSIRAGV